MNEKKNKEWILVNEKKRNIFENIEFFCCKN